MERTLSHDLQITALKAVLMLQKAYPVRQSAVIA